MARRGVPIPGALTSEQVELIHLVHRVRSIIRAEIWLYERNLEQLAQGATWGTEAARTELRSFLLEILPTTKRELEKWLDPELLRQALLDSEKRAILVSQVSDIVREGGYLESLFRVRQQLTLHGCFQRQRRTRSFGSEISRQRSAS